MNFSNSFIEYVTRSLEIRNQNQKLEHKNDCWVVILPNGCEVKLMHIVEACIIHGLDLFSELDSIGGIVR